MFSFFRKHKLTNELLNQIEEELILADLGIEQTEQIIKDLKKQRFNKEITIEELKGFVESILNKALQKYEKTLIVTRKPFVILVFGTNGSGKTTTIGKLGLYFKQQNYKVLLAAGDTFRAGATEQLQIIGNNLAIPVFSKNEKFKEPAAVIYQAFIKAKEENLDVLIADTSGRFSNNNNLMEELKKIENTLKKIDSDLPHESILVLDGTLGQASLPIAKGFLDTIKINSLIITKIDGSSKGGALLPISAKLNLPVLFLGTGEKSDCLTSFRASNFSKQLLN